MTTDLRCVVPAMLIAVLRRCWESSGSSRRSWRAASIEIGDDAAFEIVDRRHDLKFARAGEAADD